MIQRKKFIFVIVIFFLIINVNGLEISDGQTKLILHKNLGRFSLYYQPDLENNEFKPLIHDKDPRTSGTTIVIGNKIYQLGESFSFKESIEETAFGAKFTWQSKQLEIIEEFEFISSLMSPLSDGIKITFTITNISDYDLSVGARFLFDTFLGESNNIHFYLDETSELEYETSLSKDTMTNFWVSPSGTDVTDYGLQVMTQGIEVTTPDKIIFANWKLLNESSWSYTTASSRGFDHMPYSINDSAVCQYYFPETILSGLSKEVIIIMGNYNESGFSTYLESTNTGISEIYEKTNSSTSIVTASKTAVITSLKVDLSTIENLLREIDKKISNNEKMSEKDVLVIKQIMKELQDRLDKYKTE